MSNQTIIAVKKIDDPKLIEDACALLYKEYIETGSWKFSTNNPSELRAINEHNRNLLVDRITPYAIWFGAFDASKIVGCIRIFKSVNNIPFEIETYPTASEVVKQYIEPNKPNLYEVSRACVDSDYRGRNILALLYLAVAEFCQQERTSMFGTTSNGHVKSILRRIEWPCKKEDAFKFEETDLSAVNFYLATDQGAEINHIIKNIRSLKNKRTEKNLTIFEALEIVAPIFPAPMYWHDITGKVLGINTRALEGMGKSSQEILGKTPYDFYPKEIADHIWQNSLQAIDTGETLSQEESVYDASGECISTYLAVKSPLYDDDGHVLGILGTSIDITKQKELELQLTHSNQELAAGLEIKDRFIRNLSHEIRTPLQTILALPAFLKNNYDQLTDQQRKDHLDQLIQSNDRLMSLLANLLDLSQLKNKKLELDLKPIKIKDFIEKVIDEFKYLHHNIQLTIALNTPERFTGDEFRILQVLRNLIKNAIQYGSENQTILIKISFDKDESYLKFTVEDEGVGIPINERETVFDAFTESSTTRKNTGGRGLGLSLAKEIIQAHGGKIWIEDLKFNKQGTRVCFYLPSNL